MSTLTIHSAADLGRAAVGPSETPHRRSILGRIIDAIAESNRRKADIEVRRILALRADLKTEVDYALLPFAGE
jgi:hypothetical protein